MLDPRIQYLVLCVVILTVWLALNRRLARSEAEAHANWQPTTGRVERLRHTSRGDCPVVNYYIRGEAVCGALCHLRDTESSLREGQAVSILYDPEHPDHILLKRQADQEGKLGRLCYAGTFALAFLLLAKYYFTFIA